ncbi:hypothetical protein SNE40_004783 [Patella caerulea]|uniref:Uncharacterized protein n=1 Tax=Patella caerulea TaxID=87958 RepID=A0AAN8K667_PATCE
MAINIICIIIVTFITVVDGYVYGCYRPPGSTCSNHTVSCGIEEHMMIYHLYYYTKPSTVTCPLLQDEDDCKTSVCCKHGSDDKSTGFNQQDSLLIYKKCSYQQSCSFNSPYSSSTGYDYIEYGFYCVRESRIDYIMNTTTVTTSNWRYLYFSHKLTPTRGLTCSCNITGDHDFYTLYIYLSGESCNSVTITVDTQTLYTCNGEDVFKDYQRAGGVNRTSIKFTNYTSNPDDVIWIQYYKGKYMFIHYSPKSFPFLDRRVDN